MAEEEDVRVLTWPADPAVLQHRGGGEEPVALRVAFEEAPPASVLVLTDDGRPLGVTMRLEVAARQPVPLCIDICEPLCATSDYRVGVTVFDQPFAEISVAGTTRIERCAARPEPVETCAGTAGVQTPAEGTAVVGVGDVSLRAIGGQLNARPTGEDAAVAVFFPPTGIRVQLPVAAHGVRIAVVNGGAPDLMVRSLGDAGQLDVSSARIERKGTIAVAGPGVTAVEIRGGSNEAGILEVCYTPDQS
jgi:hypothetical protein